MPLASMTRAVVKKWWRRIKRGLERRCWRKARSLATVAIDDHANGTVKSSSTSIYLETYLPGLRMECTAIRGDRLVCPFCVNNRVTPFQTRSSSQLIILQDSSSHGGLSLAVCTYLSSLSSTRKPALSHPVLSLLTK